MRRSRHRLTAPAGAALAMAVAAAPLAAQGNVGRGQGAGRLNEAQMTRMMQGWRPAAQEAVRTMPARYGAPMEMTESMATWGRTEPWKKPVVSGRAVQHDFPMPHPDVMEQVIDDKVPPEMIDEITQYDGSVVVERTTGELSARWDTEGANVVALNLAHATATGKRGVADARTTYGEQIVAMKAKQPRPLHRAADVRPAAQQRGPRPAAADGRHDGRVGLPAVAPARWAAPLGGAFRSAPAAAARYGVSGSQPAAGALQPTHLRWPPHA